MSLTIPMVPADVSARAGAATPKPLSAVPRNMAATAVRFERGGDCLDVFMCMAGSKDRDGSGRTKLDTSALGPRQMQCTPSLRVFWGCETTPRALRAACNAYASVKASRLTGCTLEPLGLATLLGPPAGGGTGWIAAPGPK